MTTGSRRVSSLLRMRRSTSRPSILGSFRSRRMTCGRSCLSRSAYGPVQNRKSNASAPSRTTTSSFPILFFLSARRVSASSSGLSSTSRIILRSILPPSQSKVKGRSLSFGTFRPDPPAVDGNDPLYRGKTNTGARELADRMQPLKDPEELVCIRHVEPDTVITYIERPLLHMVFLTEFDFRLLLFGCEFPGVAQQILQHDVYQMRVCLHHEIRGQRESNLPIWLGFLQPLHNFLDHFAQINEFGLHGCPGDARKIQEVIDQDRHALGSGTHALQIAACIGRQLFSAILQHHVTESINAAQRGAQIMGN